MMHDSCELEVILVFFDFGLINSRSCKCGSIFVTAEFDDDNAHRLCIVYNFEFVLSICHCICWQCPSKDHCLQQKDGGLELKFALTTFLLPYHVCLNSKNCF